MTDCIFCRILAGQSPVSMVYQDKLCSAFMDIRPVNAGHLLVIPNTHGANLGDLDEELGAQMFRVAHRLAQAVRKSGVRCEGVNLFLADGEAAFQEVFHVHLHVIPRYDGDGFRLRFSPDYYVLPERSELDTLAERISRAL
jgi:histidine triad (HIT) family protein